MTDMQRTMVSGKGRDVALVLLVFLYLRFLQLDVRGHMGSPRDGSVWRDYPYGFLGPFDVYVRTWTGFLGQRLHDKEMAEPPDVSSAAIVWRIGVADRIVCFRCASSARGR